MTRLKAENERMYGGSRANIGLLESPRRHFNNTRSSDSGSSGRSGANFSSSTFNNKEGLPGFLIGTDGDGMLEFPGFYRKVMINILPLAYKYCSGKFEMTSQLLCF